MANSDQTNDSITEDSRVVATDEGFAVGRGSDVSIIQTSDNAFETVETMAAFLRDVAEKTQDVAELSVSKAAASEGRAYGFAAQALTQQQSDMKETMDALINKGIPLAIAAWVAVKIWGKK